MALFWKSLSACLLGVLFAFLTTTVFAGSWFDKADQILTNKNEDVVGDDIRNAQNGLRGGTQLVGKGVGDGDGNDKIYYEQIETTTSTRSKTANYVRALINYALALLGLIALVYIIYHGILTVTAAGDEGKTAKGREGIKYGAIALIGIGVAWFIVSGIVWLIQQAA